MSDCAVWNVCGISPDVCAGTFTNVSATFSGTVNARGTGVSASGSISPRAPIGTGIVHPVDGADALGATVLEDAVVFTVTVCGCEMWMLVTGKPRGEQIRGDGGGVEMLRTCGVVDGFRR